MEFHLPGLCKFHATQLLWTWLNIVNELDTVCTKRSKFIAECFRNEILANVQFSYVLYVYVLSSVRSISTNDIHIFHVALTKITTLCHSLYYMYSRKPTGVLYYICERQEKLVTGPSDGCHADNRRKIFH